MLRKILLNLLKKQKIILVFIMITSILTAIVGCFTFGVYENYHISLIQGESKSSVIAIKANGWNGKMTSRTDLLEFDLNDQDLLDLFRYNNFSTLTKGDIMTVVNNMPKEMYDDIEEIYCTGTYENDLMGFCYFDFRFHPTEKGIVQTPDDLGIKYLTDEEYINGERHISLSSKYTEIDGETEDQKKYLKVGSLSYTSDFARNIEGIGDKVEIYGCEYTVSNIFEAEGSMDMAYFIPFTSLPDDAYLDSTVSIIFKKPVNYNQFTTIRDIVDENISDDGYVEDLDLSAVSDLAYFKTIIAITMAVGLLFAINLAVLYKYVIRCNEPKIIIFRTCGATRLKCILLFLAQAVIIIAPVFAASLFAFHKLLYPAMINRFQNAAGCLNFQRYVYIFVGYLVVSVIVLLATLIKNISRKLNFREVGK